MIPHLTSSGRAVLMVAMVLVTVGVAATSWPVLVLGECLAAVLFLLCYSRTPLVVALDEGQLNLRVVPRGESEGGAVVGGRITLHLEVRNGTSMGVGRLKLTPEHHQNLSFEPESITICDLRPFQSVTVALDVTSAMVGRWALHGFHLNLNTVADLVEVSTYAGASLPMKFLPHAQTRRAPLPRATHESKDLEQMGTHLRVQRGFGSDFRELRDHQSGDPFKSIAWKATARTGRLMVREYEDEVVTNAFVILDISSTMRGGAPPMTKLQHSIRILAQLAGSVAANRDRFGLITFDETVYGHLRTNRAGLQLPDVLNHLAGLGSVVHSAFTELGDEEVLNELVRFLLVQERLDFRVGRRGPPTPDQISLDIPLLEHWLARALGRRRGELDDPCLSAGLLPGRTGLARDYCQLIGVEVPYRLESRFGAKEVGLVEAIERFLHDKREPHLLLLITDLCGIIDLSGIVNALRVVRSRKHRAAVVMPYTPDFVPLTSLKPAPTDRDRIIYETLRLAEHRERRRLSRQISTLGIPVIPIGPQDRLGTLMRRIRMR